MTTVSEGMDSGRVREIARSMMAMGQRVESVESRGQSQLATLEGAWAGEDLTAFADRWHEAVPQLQHAGQALHDMGRDLFGQAGEQEGASRGSGTGHPTPREFPDLPPTTTGPLPEGQGVLDRILGAIIDQAEGVGDGMAAALDGLSRGMNQLFLKMPMVLSSLVGSLRELSTDFAKWTDELIASTRKAIDAWAPKLTNLGEKLLPVPRFLSKFAKVIPGLGAVVAAWDAQEVLSDLWHGKINPHEYWNKIALGGVASVAGFFPGVGTLVSGLLTLDQVGQEYAPRFDDWVADHTGLDPATVTTARSLLQGPVATIGDLLPDESLDLPGPAPEEVVRDGWEAVKDVSSHIPDPPIRLPSPSLPDVDLPWP